MAEPKKTNTELNAEIRRLRKEIELLNQKKDEANNELKLSEAKFRKLSDSAFEGIAIHHNGIVLQVNKAVCALFEYEENEFIGRSILDFIHPDFQTTVLERIKMKITSPYEIMMLKKGNRPFWVELLGNQINYNGTEARVTAIRDLSAQKETQNKIIESERKFSVLSNNFPGIAYRCLLDEQLTMLFLSNGFHKLTGYNADDFINNKKRSFSEIVYPADKGNSNILKALTKKEIFELEYRIITANGETKWVWEKGQGVFDENNKLLFLEGFIADNNEKKQFEIELNKSRENYKQLFDYSPDGVVIHIEGKVIFSNKSVLRILGADSFEQLENKSVFDYILPEYHQKVIDRIFKNSKGIDWGFTEIKIKNLKSEIVTVETKPTPIVFNGLQATQVILRDLTEHKKLLEEQLRAQVAEETNFKLQQEINERKKTERILFANQKYTRLLIESSLDIICASDKNGNITEFNPAAQKTFGYELHEVLGKHVKMLYADPNDSTHITEDELIENGIYVGEVLNKKKNGEKFISFLSASVLKNEAGEIVGAMGVSRDISESKKAEQELRDSEERYRAIYNQVYVGIAKVSLEGQFLQANQQLCKILGYTNEELCQKSFVDITTPEDMERTVAYWDKFLLGHTEKESYEKKYFHKSGRVVYVNLTISMVKDADGKAAHFIGVFQDITQRKKNEQEQQVQAAKLNAIFDSGSHLIWTVDTDSCLTSFNKNFSLYIQQQYDVETMIGLSMIEGNVFSNEEYNNFWISKYSQTAAGIPQYFETKFINKLRGDIWYEIFLNPIFDDKGKVVEISGIGHDITEKIISNEKIQQSLAEKEILLKEVHHRVKNNLQVISSILNLQSSYVKDQNTLNLLRESQNRIKSMAFIHESLYQTKDFSNINFSEYVVNLSQNLLHTYSDSKFEIKLNLDIQIKFLILDLAIPTGLIINELVTNAIKYAFNNETNENSISIAMINEDENIKLIVEDNGVGLPSSINFRDTESLGLQLVVTLVDQINGKIELDNTKGAKYSIVFKHNQIKNKK